MKDKRANTYEIAGHLVLVKNWGRGGRKYYEGIVRAQYDSPHPVDPSSSVEKPVPLGRGEYETVLDLRLRTLHWLVNPECVGLLIPTVRVLACGVVCIQPNWTVLVN